MAYDKRFRTATQAALIDVVADMYTHDEVDQLFRRLDVDDWESDRGRTKLRRVGDAVDALIQRGPIHGNDILELCRIVLEEKLNGRVEMTLKFSPAVRRLVNGLKADGYELVDHRLAHTDPDAAPLAEEMTVLATELETRGWTVALTHYQQAVANFTDGEFESSNAQLRSFLEELLTKAAATRTGKSSRDPRGNIDKLTNSRMLGTDEAQFLKGLAGLSNTKGSHPGISSSDEALFRLHVTVASARWVLALLGTVTCTNAAP